MKFFFFYFFFKKKKKVMAEVDDTYRNDTIANQPKIILEAKLSLPLSLLMKRNETNDDKPSGIGRGSYITDLI